MPNRNKRRGGRSKVKKSLENKNRIEQEKQASSEIDFTALSTSGLVLAKNPQAKKLKPENSGKSLNSWKEFSDFFEYLLNKAERNCHSKQKTNERIEPFDNFDSDSTVDYDSDVMILD